VHAALYYTHSSLNNAELIKSALLLWDRVEYIKPDWYEGPARPFPNAPQHEKNQLSEALELIGAGREPTNGEKESAHLEIEKLIRSRLPDWILFTPDNPHTHYSIFPDKLLPKTWQMLKDENLADLTPAFSHGPNFRDWSMHKSLGLLVMSILAKACATNQKMMITDESDAYAMWTRCITREANGRYGKLALADDVAPNSNLLVTTSISVLTAKSINLRTLLNARRRELQELKLEKGKVIWSREMAAGLVFTVGTFLAPFLSSAIGIGELGSLITPVTGIMAAGALRKTQLEFQAAKQKALENHPMSWLYIAAT
jgi:hypothetical protein